MASLPIGSDELVYIQTEKVRVTIKGQASHPDAQGAECMDKESTIQAYCDDPYEEFSLKGDSILLLDQTLSNASNRKYKTIPLFYEQQRYEIVIEALDEDEISFWHDNYNIRKQVTTVGHNERILSGVLCFGNEIGMSDLVVRLNGEDYLRIVIEVFPSKISYKDDYKAIVADVTAEVYNLIFDLLKKTYLSYRQGEKTTTSPVEFFAVISKIYDDFIKAADMILMQPHHELETIHTILPSYKVKQTDNQSIRWIEKHPNQAKKVNGHITVAKTLAVQKQVTYDTKENRLTKYILESTAKKLLSFEKNYQRLQRDEDEEVIRKIEIMIQGINRRCNTGVLANVPSMEGSFGMSLVFSMAAGYRELYRCYLMLLRGLSVTGDVFNISVKDLAVLYEYWCFIKLNSIMKERYELVSQDIVKVQGNGLFVSLVKGKSSCVRYRDPATNERITLSYNPKEIDVPTVTQRPDNVLTLEKHGADVQYEYVFDAKYKIDSALPGTDYYATISHHPGPKVEDINTMHRYRDAIVYRNGATPFERTMFGAYVLFPYNNEEEYREHRFYKSIEKVNVGGLPFLPTATNMVTELLDELVSDSPESAFERSILPRGTEEKLAKVDWTTRDVLVGTLRSKEQLDVCLQHKFYYAPANRLPDRNFPIHYVAIYQSKRLFGKEAGIQYYGEVVRCTSMPRNAIKEMPKASNEPYYRFEIKEWKELTKPIAVKEAGPYPVCFTNLFLLQHSSEMPELWLQSEAEYRLYSELKRAINDTEINDETNNLGFVLDDYAIHFEDGNICVSKEGKIIAEYSIKEFSRRPNATFRRLEKELKRIDKVSETYEY